MTGFDTPYTQFVNVLKQLGKEPLARSIFAKIQADYSSEERHYHTISHIRDVFSELEYVKDQIANWTVVTLAVIYHDIVYIPGNPDNEARSANRAESDLTSWGIDSSIITSVIDYILATSRYPTTDDADKQYFMDADLAILGKDESSYRTYVKKIRLEFARFDDATFSFGRKQILQAFLSRERIYQSAFFHGKYERQARQNLKKEIEEL